MMEANVWDRRETDDTIISATAYNFVIGATLLWGFWVNYLMVSNLDPNLAFAWGRWTFFILYFVSCFGGIYLFNSSDQPIVSFIGYNLVVVPFGFIVNAMVSQYQPAIVLDAIRTTGGVTIIMMLLGSAYPAFFQKIVGALTAALFAVIIVEMIGIFFFDAHPGILDWIVALIFCGYIGYDWGRANSIPKTVDNAIDSAASLYMDIINLFLRILRIMGNRR